MSTLVFGATPCPLSLYHILRVVDKQTEKLRRTAKRATPPTLQLTPTHLRSIRRDPRGGRLSGAITSGLPNLQANAGWSFKSDYVLTYTVLYTIRKVRMYVVVFFNLNWKTLKSARPNPLFSPCKSTLSLSSSPPHALEIEKGVGFPLPGFPRSGWGGRSLPVCLLLLCLGATRGRRIKIQFLFQSGGGWRRKVGPRRCARTKFRARRARKKGLQLFSISAKI